MRRDGIPMNFESDFGALYGPLESIFNGFRASGSGSERCLSIILDVPHLSSLYSTSRSLKRSSASVHCPSAPFFSDFYSKCIKSIKFPSSKFNKPSPFPLSCYSSSSVGSTCYPSRTWTLDSSSAFSSSPTA